MLPPRNCPFSLAIPSIVCLLLVWFPAAPAAGQLGAPPPRDPEKAPHQTLDLMAMLLSDGLEPTSVDDEVWTVTSRPGRKLFLLPVELSPKEAATQVSDPAFDVRGGRFVAWYIPTPGEGAVFQSRRESPAGGASGAPGARSIESMLLMDGDFDLGGSRTPPAPAPSPTPAPPAQTPTFGDDSSDTVPTFGTAGGPALPPNAPRITRQLHLSPAPEGRLRWEMDRALPGAEVRDGAEPYQLKLRGDRLRDLQPPRLERVERQAGEDARDYADRRRAAQQTYSDALRTYRELADLVRDLPERFDVPRPPRIWAIYEVSDTSASLTIDKLGNDTLFPWTVTWREFEALRGMASPTAGASFITQPGVGGAVAGEGATLTPEAIDLLRVLQPMALADSPMSHRAVALAMNEAGLAGAAELNGPLYVMFQSLLASPDEQARQVALRDVATTFPPTRATALLLGGAAEHMGPEIKLLALDSLFRAEAGSTDPQRLQEMVTAAQEAMAEPDSADAGDILRALTQQLAATADPNAGQFGQPATPGDELARPLTDAETAAMQHLALAKLPEDRRRQAIRYVVTTAGTQPLSNALFQQQLLGAGDPAVLLQTLRVLNRGSSGETKSVVAAAAEGLRGVIFGKNEEEKKHEAAEAAEVASGEAFTLDAPLVLDSPRHPIFRALSSQEAEVRELGWKAMRHFEIPAGADSAATDPFGQPIEGAVDDVQQRYDQVLSAGLGNQVTPEGLVAFLARQPDKARGTKGLLQVLLRGDDAAAKRAAETLLASDRALGEALVSLPPEGRVRVAQRLYALKRDSVPLVVALLKEQTQGQPPAVATWFGERLSEGELPPPGRWIEAYADERSLIELAASNDPELSHAAVAALVAAEGGDDQAASELARKISNLPVRTSEAIQEVWTQGKRDVFLARLRNAEGRYRLLLLEVDRGGVEQTTPLGIVPLIVHGTAVNLASGDLPVELPDDVPAMRIDAGSIKNLKHDKVAALPLETAATPLDLTQADDGSWSGTVELPDLGEVGLRLEPLKEE